MEKLTVYTSSVVLVLIFIGMGLFGAWSAYILLIVAALSGFILISSRALPWIAGDKTAILFAFSFALFALAFVVTARKPHDVIYALNYVPLLLFSPLSAMLSAQAGALSARKVAAIALIGTGVLAGYALFQKLYLGVLRPDGVEVDTIAYAHTAVVIGFLSAGAALVAKGWLRWLCLFGPVLGLVVSLLTLSRGAIIAVPVLSFIILAFWSRKPLFSAIAAVVSALIALWLVWVISPNTFQRIMSIVVNLNMLVDLGYVAEGSTDVRLEMYVAGMRAFLDAPIFGHGWEQKFAAIQPYLQADSVVATGIHHHLHADPIDVAVSAGLTGLVAHCLILAAPFVGALSSPRDSQYRARLLMSVVLGVAYAIFGLTYLLFGYEYHTTLYVALAAVVVGYCRDDKSISLTRNV